MKWTAMVTLLLLSQNISFYLILYYFFKENTCTLGSPLNSNGQVEVIYLHSGASP